MGQVLGGSCELPDGDQATLTSVKCHSRPFGGTGSEASGLGTVIFDSAAVTASYSFTIEGVDFGPVTGGLPQTPETEDDVTRTHFHTAAAGVNGPIVFGQIDTVAPANEQDDDDFAVALNADGSWSLSGVWETTDPPSPTGVTITDFADDLGSATVGMAVPLYFNVHTSEFGGGEIRGQLIAIAANDNVVDGTAGNDLLPGLGGDDIIRGFAGDDTLQGGDGNDTLLAGRGNDTLEGGAGNDFLSGGQGDDNINTGQGDDVVDGGAGNDQIGGMAGRDIVRAGAGDDFIAWNDPTGDVVFGDRGNDTILGGNIAADEIHGGAGDDLIRAFATSPKSATASDRLFGDAGDDVVIGGNAADIIEGGRGDDILTGNDGADVFRFANQTGDDTITDFDPSEDVVELVGFDASFDPLAALSATSQGTEMDLGGGNSVLLLGRTVAEFSADDFQIV